LILKKVETDRGYENLNRYRLLLFFLVGCKLRLAFKAFSKKKKKDSPGISHICHSHCFHLSLSSPEKSRKED